MLVQNQKYDETEITPHNTSRIAYEQEYNIVKKYDELCRRIQTEKRYNHAFKQTTAKK